MTFTDAIRPTRYALIDFVAAIKESAPCTDCSQYFPACCMDFDHRPGEIKTACVGKLVMSASLEDVETEIAKCDLVCANCHRIRTRDRHNAVRQDAGRELKAGIKTQREIARTLGRSEAYISELKRAAKGLKPRKQLTAEQRDEIRRLAGSGISQREIAVMFNCSQSHISLVVNRKRGL